MGKCGIGLMKGEILTRGERSQHFASLTSEKPQVMQAPDPREVKLWHQMSQPDS